MQFYVLHICSETLENLYSKGYLVLAAKISLSYLKNDVISSGGQPESPAQNICTQWPGNEPWQSALFIQNVMCDPVSTSAHAVSEVQRFGALSVGGWDIVMSKEMILCRAESSHAVCWLAFLFITHYSCFTSHSCHYCRPGQFLK